MVELRGGAPRWSSAAVGGGDTDTDTDSSAVPFPRDPTPPGGYSHQLDPVRPSSSPFSEFHTKLFQPPSSLLAGIFVFLPFLPSLLPFFKMG